ncbi:hypothetical protein [Streptomyces sp. NPDC051546]|uniref:hypothetical protein n=1 Tax=Streptomyces sp. NPDC051546 TaxID=3365655 RepID=UPI003793F690
MTERVQSGPQMKPAEEMAVKVVVALLTAERNEPMTFKQHDVPPLQGAHDFWIDCGGTREALEVTTFAEQQSTTRAAHWQKRGPGDVKVIEGITSAWAIVVDQTFRAEALTKNLAEWLRALESEGITETGRWDSQRCYVHPVTMALAAAGVMRASIVPGLPAGTVSLAYVSDVPTRPAGDPNHVTRALTEVLALERHQKDAAKLDRSGVPVRHLFLWVDMASRWDVVRAFDEGTPTIDPRVDERITWVWLAVPTENGADVLRWTAGTGWRRDEVGV